MGLRTRLLRLGVVALAAMAAISAPREAQAAPDNFGIGDGHSGALTVAGSTAAAPRVVNSYASILNDVGAGATTITIGHLVPNAATAFAAGDLILVWRATGVDAAQAPSGNQSRINLALPTPAGSPVGAFEFARITGVTGAAGNQTLTLAAPMVKGFAKLVSQVVRVPEYTTVNVPANQFLSAAPWQEVGTPGNPPDPTEPNPNNPWAGGILIFLAQGAITNNGTIHSNARGFHGGLPKPRLIGTLGVLCDNNSLDGNPNLNFAPKGQGIVHSRYATNNTAGGRGNVAIAGGGGNCLEGGGGGGANRGGGGNGSSSLINLGTGGLGGGGVDYDLMTRLSMGGGGGAGRHIVGLNSQVSFGGFGGGVVYIRGGSMAGNGLLQSNGGNGENSGLLNLPTPLVSESSGGGGAGGTIVVRLVGTLDCKSLGGPGGNGGNAAVLGINLFGAGGGGGGGRVLYQAADKTANCTVDVTPGTGGNNTAQPGQPGTNQPPPGGGFCTGAAPPAPGSCADPKPICDQGVCQGCSGPFGGGTPQACGVNVEPVCLQTGACVPCEGDFGSANTAACQLTASPYCFVTGGPGPGPVGSCGKCTTNAECAGPTHPGPICNVVAGNCGTACTRDEDCKSTEWCAPQDAQGGNVCTPKTPNSQPLPGIPPIDGECTVEKGQRVCLSAKCEESDDLCGLKNNAPCGAATECRSNICFERDNLCGLPNGEPCTGDGVCRSDKCDPDTAVCIGCEEDTDCKISQVCDKGASICVEGCRPGVQNLADGGRVHGACAAGNQCVVVDGGDIGVCQPIPVPDAGPDAAVDDFGLIEGGGCSCNTTLSSAASPFAIFGAACGALLLARRRRNSRSKTRDVSHRG